MAHPAPTGIVYGILLVAHVATAIVGFGALVLSGYEAGRARRGPETPWAAEVRRYFKRGVNYTARVVYLVPLLGFALVADSGGAYRPGQAFVIAGVVIWSVAVLLAELVVWPGERRVQQVVTSSWGRSPPGFETLCIRVSFACIIELALFVVAFVVMVHH